MTIIYGHGLLALLQGVPLRNIDQLELFFPLVVVYLLRIENLLKMFLSGYRSKPSTKKLNFPKIYLWENILPPLFIADLLRQRF